MLKDLLTEEMVLLDGEVDTPEEAIRLAGDLLVKAGKVEERYVDAMVHGFQTIGPYIVLAPSIAIPHARPENGVLEKCVSFVRLKKPVAFYHPTNDPVELVFAFGGVDHEGHIGMLQALASVLGNPQKVEGLKHIASYQELLAILE